MPEPAGGVTVEDRILKPLGYERITSLSAAAALTVPAGARYAWVQAETQNVRWRDDGTNPTSTQGMLLSKDSDGFWYTSHLAAVRFIEVSPSAVLNVSYYG